MGIFSQYILDSKFCTKRRRFILSLLSYAIFSFGIAGMHQISHLSVYITSYFHYQQQTINMQLGNLIRPLFLVSFSLANPFGGFLEKKIGTYFSIIFCFIINEVIIFIFINQTNLLLTFFLICLLGINCGICHSIPRKNIYSFYPKRRAIIGAFMEVIFISISAFVLVLGEKTINPKKIVLKEGEHYYSYEICKKYRTFYKYYLFIIPFSLLFSILLLEKYNPSKDEGEITKIEIKSQQIDKISYKLKIKSAIFNSRIWKIALFTKFAPFAINFSINTFRVYGALMSFNGTIMQYFGLLSNLSVIIFGPIWGLINDSFPYQVIIKIIIGGTVVHSIFLTLFIKSNIIYSICTFIGPVFFCGLANITQPHIIQVYGIEYFIELEGLVRLMGGVKNIIQIFILYVISKTFKDGPELQIPYRIIYGFSIFLCCFCYYISCNEGVDEFDYKVDESNKIEIENVKSVDKGSKDNEGKNEDTGKIRVVAVA